MRFPSFKKCLFLSLCVSVLIFADVSVFARYVVRPLDQAVFHNNQGVAYLNQGEAQKALFEFKTATELSKEYTEAWNNLGLTYLFLKNYDEAKKAFEKSIKIDPKYPAPYNHMATLYYTLGDYSEAIRWTEQAIKKDKKFADAYYNQGVAYREQALKTKNPADYQAGERAFRLATEANSRHYLANFELGNLYKNQGKLEEALIRYKVALEIQPSAADVWIELGSLYLMKGEHAKAQFALNKAIEANPQHPGVHLYMGLYYLQEKNYVLAEKELELARKSQPEDPRILFNMAYAKFSQAEDLRGRSGATAARPLYEEAVRRYLEAIERFPTHTDATYNLAYAYTRLEDAPHAVEWYEKTLRIDPRHARALFGLGILKLQSGDKSRALELLCQFTRTTQADLKASREAAQKIIAEHGKCD